MQAGMEAHEFAPHVVFILASRRRLGSSWWRYRLDPSLQLQTGAGVFRRVLSVPHPETCLIWLLKLYAELLVGAEFRAGVTLVMLEFKCKNVPFHVWKQQRCRVSARYVPGLTGVTAFLKIEKHRAANLTAGIVNF